MSVPRGTIGLMCLAWLALARGARSEAQHPSVLSRLAFETNLGQFDRSVRFAFRGPEYTAFFLSDRVTIAFPAKGRGVSSLSMRLKGASPRLRLEGVDVLPVHASYFRGRDPSRWVRSAPHYARLQYRNVYPGIDLVFREGGGRELEYDWVVAPGANPATIRVRFDKGAGVLVDSGGDLVVRKDGFEWRHRKPAAYQTLTMTHRAVGASFRIREHRDAAFELARYDRRATLVIDPALGFSLLFGGAPTGYTLTSDSGNAVAVGPSGLIYAAGAAASLDFPRMGAGSKFGVHQLGSDAFLARVGQGESGDFSDLSVYFLGGSGDDSATGVAFDSQANVYLTGSTQSPDFPLVNAMQTANGGGFAAKFSADFSQLLYSTYLGGPAAGIAVDSAGSAFIAGNTGPPYFSPTPGAFQVKPGPNGDPFVIKLDTTGKLVYATYVGGSGYDQGRGIAVDAASNAYITGSTGSHDFPVTAGVFEPACTLCSGAFVAELNATGTALVFSTYLGAESDSYGSGIALDAEGNIYVAGSALTPGSVPGITITSFPTTPGAFITTTKAASAAFVAKLSPGASALVYSTLLAGPSPGNTDSAGSSAGSIAVDSSGSAYVAGSTSQPDFPLLQPLQAAFGGPVPDVSNTGVGLCNGASPQNNFLVPCTDAFVSKLLPDGSGLEWSTFFGGGDNDFASAVSVSAGNVYVAGVTESTDFPATVYCPGGYGMCYAGQIPMPLPGSSVFLLSISQSAAAPGLSSAGVTSAGSFVTGLAPGSLSSVFGTGFTTQSGVLTAAAPLPTDLGGVSVLVDNSAVPLLAVSAQQINFVAPWIIPAPGVSTATLVVTVNGVPSIPVQVPVSEYLPAVYVTDGVHAAAQHSSDYSLVTSSHPAHPGEVIVLYADGLGLVQPTPEPGAPAPANPPATTVANPVVTIGGAQADVLFSGLAPGFVNLYQLNIQLPPVVAAGDQDLLVSILTVYGPLTSKAAKLPVSP